MPTLNIIGNTQVDPFIPEVIAQKALGKLEDGLYLGQNVTRDLELGVTAKEGDKVIIGKRGTLTPNAKTAGESVTFQTPTATKVEVALNKHYEVSFNYDDITKTVNGHKQISEEYIADGILGLAEQMEDSLAALASGFTNSVGARGGTIDYDDILSMRETLTKAKAPRSDRFLYLDPAQISALLNIDKFIEVSKYGPNMAIAEGELGRISGFRVFESNFVADDGASPATLYNIAMHRWGMVVAIRPIEPPSSPYVQVGYANKNGLMVRVIKTFNASYLCDQVTIDCLYGCSLLRPELGIKYLS